MLDVGFYIVGSWIVIDVIFQVDLASMRVMVLPMLTIRYIRPDGLGWGSIAAVLLLNNCQ